MPLTDKEQGELDEWTERSDRNRELFSSLQAGIGLKEYLEKRMDKQGIQQALEDFWVKMQVGKGAAGYTKEKLVISPKNRLEPLVARPVHRRKAWYYAAAAMLLVLAGAGVYCWKKMDGHPAQMATVNVLVPDIAPGKNGAVLTLSNGTKIVLDSLNNGMVALQNGTKVVLKNGRLVYDAMTAATADAMVYNTMSTPKGRQFQLSLQDGTKVWLNSASSIRYPAFFSGNSREVAITGEAYFEVSQKVNMPFNVKVNEHTIVKVLGTSFNINAYPDEASINTTLLDGAVKLSSGKQEVLMLPGQQAQLKSTTPIHLVQHADIEKVMAWKNGIFSFDGLPLQEVMRQLSRWYDIEVVYEKNVPSIEFAGEMDRTVSLSGLLKGLEGFGVHFRMEANHRRLVVLP